jgi:hypothetical protein
MTPPTEDAATKAAREMDAEWCADTSTRLKEYARERQQFFARYLHKFAEARRAPSGFAVEAERVVRKLATFPVARAPERALTEPERLVLVARDLVAMLPPRTIGYQPAAGPVQGHPGHGASVDGVPVGNVEAVGDAIISALQEET